MAKISTYAPDSLISVDDKLIGTDAENSNITKNFLVGDLLTFIGSNLTNLPYIPYTGAAANVNLGNYNLTAKYIEAADEIYSTIVGGESVDVWNNLTIKNGSVINLNGVTGNPGDIIISDGEFDNPSWQSQTAFFANAILTLPTYDSNAEALIGGLVQGQLYKSTTGVVSIVL